MGGANIALGETHWSRGEYSCSKGKGMEVFRAEFYDLSNLLLNSLAKQMCDIEKVNMASIKWSVGVKGMWAFIVCFILLKYS